MYSVALNNILRHEWDEITGEWRKLHNEELNALYSLPSEIEKNEVGGACSVYGGEEMCLQCFGEETSGEDTTWKTQA